MSRHDLIQTICDNGIMPCWRADDSSAIIDASKALADVGFNNVELTMTMPGNLRLIERAVAELPASTIVGAGTVLDAETARAAILAGARYVVSPALVPEVVTMCHRYDVPVVIGAYSPTEILAAKTLGADMIKIYPAGIGGPSFIAEVCSVFKGIRTAVAGCVLLGDIGDFIAAGADVGVIGMPQIAREAYAERRFDEMQRIAKRLLDVVREARTPEAMRRRADDAAKRYVDLDGAKQRAAATR
ncbi:MAG: 2-dehydro-3-deoxyphosphogluconate aldolase [Planctomycetes bacterium]|nr:2-dehydro-3-deoxyphosphogluconate aldolase [Planctomycetota bacterium]